MKKSLENSVVSLTIVAITAIIAIMVCCLATLGYNSKVTVDKEKIEVKASTSDSNQTQPDM